MELSVSRRQKQERFAVRLDVAVFRRLALDKLKPKDLGHHFLNDTKHAAHQDQVGWVLDCCGFRVFPLSDRVEQIAVLVLVGRGC